jgi:phospho-N-acetylmuramoyl-pentapeptide-transferase
MLFYLAQYFTPEHPIANLLRYITVRASAAGLFSFIIVVVFMPAMIRFLKKIAAHQVIRDDGPKTHASKKGTPTMGGLLMVLAIALTGLSFCRWDNPLVWISLFVLVSFAAVGFIDDFLKLTKKNTKGVSGRVKLLLLGILTVISVALANRYGVLALEINMPFFKDFYLSIGAWFFAWAFLVIVGCSNAVNLTDGLDGLAIVPIMTTAAVFMIVSYVLGHAILADYLQFDQIAGAGELTVIMAGTVGAGLGFLWYNSHPAEVFMGDTGSLSLGGLLGAVAILTRSEFVLLIAGFLFVLEAVSVILQVGFFKTTKKRVLRMAPLHHHFELKGWAEAKVITRFWILSIIFAIVALSTLKIR